MDRVGKNEIDMYEKESILLNDIKKDFSDEKLSQNELETKFSFLIKSYGKLLKLIRKITRVGDANQRKLLVAYNEIDKQKKALDDAYLKLDQLARKDPLTQLSNRRDFLEKVSTEKIRFERDKKTFAFVLSDIDNFKLFNDKYGHDCGDFVLKKVAERYIPRDCLYRPKEGFSIPIKQWLKSSLRPLMERSLSPDRLRSQGIFDQKEVVFVLECWN